MALTATASDTLIAHIIKDTGMIDPVLVQVSPDKKNLRFMVEEITSMEERFLPIAKSLKNQRTSYNKIIIFCQRQVDCGNLYQFFERELRDKLVEPIGIPTSLPQFRLVDTFTKSTEKFVKDIILQQATKKDLTLRVLIYTAAFGMGIDCVGVQNVIHWGPPQNIETYIQQAGRSGRNDDFSYCKLLYGKGLSRFCDKPMLTYCKNNIECRRQVLFSDFKCYVGKDANCDCCDICANNCKCEICLNLINNLNTN